MKAIEIVVSLRELAVDLEKRRLDDGSVSISASDLESKVGPLLLRAADRLEKLRNRLNARNKNRTSSGAR